MRDRARIGAPSQHGEQIVAAAVGGSHRFIVARGTDSRSGDARANCPDQLVGAAEDVVVAVVAVLTEEAVVVGALVLAVEEGVGVVGAVVGVVDEAVVVVGVVLVAGVVATARFRR